MQRSIENPRFGMIVFGASRCSATPLGNYVLIFGKLGLPRARHHGCGGSDASVPRGGVRRSRSPTRSAAAPMPLNEARHPPPRHATCCVNSCATARRCSSNETLWGTGFSMITVIMGHMATSSDLIAAYTAGGQYRQTDRPPACYGIAGGGRPSSSARRSASAAAHKGVVQHRPAPLCLTAFRVRASPSAAPSYTACS